MLTGGTNAEDAQKGTIGSPLSADAAHRCEWITRRVSRSWFQLWLPTSEMDL